jgi:hypothetical protein
LERVKTFDQDDVVAACAKRLRPDDIPRYRHLGVRIKDGELIVPDPSVPPPARGRYSLVNVEGKEVVRYDLPMIDKTFTWETPNWGDWSKGSHTHGITRKVYQREFMPPKELELSVTLLQRAGDDVVLKFEIDQVLNRRRRNFEDELLFNLNLLQENVGAADVFPSAATLAEYTRTLKLDWEILPPGTVDEVIRRMLQGKRPVPPETRAVMEDRLKVLAKLNPIAYVAGTSEFLRYFGAQFGDDFVVFENLNYGNAVYVMYERWATLSQRSRIELLKAQEGGFVRIPHRPGWKKRLRAVVLEYRREEARDDDENDE